MFVYRELCHAILPAMGLRETFRRWSAITKALADTKRKRKRQILS